MIHTIRDKSTFEFKLASLMLAVTLLALTTIGIVAPGVTPVADRPEGTSSDLFAGPQTGAANLPSEERVSAVTALNNGRPTVLFFFPIELCQLRYCLTAHLVEQKLVERFEDRFNFVPVNIWAMAANSDKPLPFADWDLYPVEPYVNWIPGFTGASTETGLLEPTIVVVSREGEVVYSESYIDMDRLGQVVIGE